MLPDINQLTLAEQVAQMVVVRASGFLFDHQIQYPAWEPPAAILQYWVQDLGVGGVILLGAGADILLMPIDPETAIRAVCEAVESGSIMKSRIRESVQRIWQAKRKIFPLQVNTIDLRDLSNHIAQNDSCTIVTEILQHSQTVYCSVLPSENLIDPVKPNYFSAPNLRNLIVVDDLLKCDFLNFRAPAITLPEQMGYMIQISDSHTPDTANLEANHLTLLQIFTRGNPLRGSSRLTQASERLFKKLLINGKSQALVVYGSPYAMQQFIPLVPPNIKTVFSYGQMPALQDIALRRLFGM